MDFNNLELVALGISSDGKSSVSTPSESATDGADAQVATSSTVPIAAASCDWKLPLFFFIFGCLFSAVAVTNALRNSQFNKDYSHWYRIGRAVLRGEPLYADVRNGEPEYMYPPTAAVLFYMPLSILGPITFVALLSLINAVAWGLSAWFAATLVGGNWNGRPFHHLIFPGIVVAPYVWDIQLLGQLNLLLLALTLGSFLAQRFRHPLLASGLFGAAVSMKAFPLPAIAYFVVRREWKTVVASLLSIVALVWFFPGLVRGLQRNTTELKQWASLMIADQSGRTMAGRSTIGFTRRNQSLVSCSHRLLRHVESGGDPDNPCYVNIADVEPRTAQLVGYAACLSLGLILLLACRFQFGTSYECEGLEIAMVCTLVPLCSPLAWTYFFCWLIPGWAGVMYWSSDSRLDKRTRTHVKIGSWIALILLVSAISEQFNPTLQACGVTALGSVVLFLTLAYIRFVLPPVASAQNRVAC